MVRDSSRPPRIHPRPKPQVTSISCTWRPCPAVLGLCGRCRGSQGPDSHSGSDEAAEASPGQREPCVQSLAGGTCFCCTLGSPVEPCKAPMPRLHPQQLPSIVSESLGAEPLHEQAVKRLG